MTDEVSTYVSEQAEPARSQIESIYARARLLVPEAVEGVSYGMPTLLYKGKGLISIMKAKHHIGIYPFGNLAELASAVADAGLSSTKGAIHLGPDQSLPDELLDAVVSRRKAQIDAAGSRRRGPESA